MELKFYIVKFQFPGWQSNHISGKLCFPTFNADASEDIINEECLISAGFEIKYIPNYVLAKDPILSRALQLSILGQSHQLVQLYIKKYTHK